jgi:hypothetical protein
MANRLDILNQLANNVPDLEKQSATQNKSARMALLAQQLGQPQVQNVQQAQQVALQNKAVEGQQRVQDLEQSQKRLGAIGSMALEQQSQAGQETLARQEMAQESELQGKSNAMAQRLQNENLESRKRMTQSDIEASNKLQALGKEYDSRLQFATTKQREDLARLGNGIKQELIDSRLAFDKDERGRAFSNSRQLFDYAVVTAKNEQEYNNKIRAIKNAADEEAQTMNDINTRLATILERGWLEQEGDLDREAEIKLVNMRNAVEQRAAKAKAKAANNLAMGQAIGTLAGAVIGGVAGSALGPAGTYKGAAVGASLGANLGGSAGSFAASQGVFG